MKLTPMAFVAIALALSPESMGASEASSEGLLVLSLTRPVGSPLVVVDPRGLVSSDVLITIPLANQYAQDELPDDDAENVTVEIRNPVPGMYTAHVAAPQGGESTSLLVRNEVGNALCGVIIEGYTDGLPPGVAIYRFVLELAGDSCIVRSAPWTGDQQR